MRAAQLLLCGLLCTAPGWAQRHLPELHIFSTTEAVRLDTYVEHPAINHGMGIADMPQRGETLTFQIFVPRAGGLAAFESTVTLDTPDLFRIVSAKNWHQRDMARMASKAVQTFYTSRLSLAQVPSSGHIATVTLEPVENGPPLNALQISCSITIASIPPRRIWHMHGSQSLLLR